MDLTPEQKARIHDQCRGSASSHLRSRRNLNKLSIAQRSKERKMLSVALKDHKTNDWLGEHSKITVVVKCVATLKRQWAGHVARKFLMVKGVGRMETVE